MKKKNNKGFLLVETLIVSTFAASTMIFIFIQFRRITTEYDRSFSYNTVEGLYATHEINKYILNNGFEKIVEYMSGRTEDGETADPEPYVILYDGNSCSSVYLYETDYCNHLMKELNVKQVLVTYSDLNTDHFRENIDDYDQFDQGFKRFVKYIKYDEGDTELLKKRTIVTFNDDTYATLKLYRKGGA